MLTLQIVKIIIYYILNLMLQSTFCMASKCISIYYLVISYHSMDRSGNLSQRHQESGRGRRHRQVVCRGEARVNQNGDEGRRIVVLKCVHSDRLKGIGILQLTGTSRGKDSVRGQGSYPSPCYIRPCKLYMYSVSQKSSPP